MRNLRVYQTETERENDTIEFNKPYVHYVREKHKVYFMGKKDTNGYDYVDLGLPSKTLWATCNVGANKPEEFGRYFPWADTIGYTATPDYSNLIDGNYYEGKVNEVNGEVPDISMNSSPYYDESLANTDSKGYSKYTYISSASTGDGRSELELIDDAAHVNMGGDWRMPTIEQARELMNNTTYATSVINNISGVTLTSNANGNGLFLPFAGDCAGSDLYNVGCECTLWTASVYPKAKELYFAYQLHYLPDSSPYVSRWYRFIAYSVRGVI